MKNSIMYVLKVLGPAVQSIVSLTASLRRQLVKDMLTTLSFIFFSHCYFLLKKCENLNARYSHIFPTKDNSVFVIITF